MSERVESEQIFSSRTSTTTCIENADILSFGFTMTTKVIGSNPIPAPIVTRRRFV
jgi:hypothetical protein